MARSISSSNLAYHLRKGQPDLLGWTSDPKQKRALDKDILNSTYQVDYQPPGPRPPSDRGKRKELVERFLFEKISADLAAHEFRPRSPPSYVSTTRQSFDVPGFDPDASLLPEFQYSLYADPAISFWSEHKRVVPGVTATDNPTGFFHSSSAFSKPIGERWEDEL